MFLHADKNFHYETIRSLSVARYGGGCDIAETLALMDKIRANNFEDWYREWNSLALRVLSTIDESKLDSYSPVTLREVYFRASHYFFVADFFLHGNQADPRLRANYDLWRLYFQKANALLPIPGKYVDIETSHGFTLPIIIYRAASASASNPRPTLLVGGGFDSNYEETYHVFAVAALERGYNVILYEGPGQPTLLHTQQKGFIAEWEQAVTPIVDYIFEQNSGALDFIDTAKIGLVGMSLGGYLAARAAAFEPRLAATILIDGVWSFEMAIFSEFTECKDLWAQGQRAQVEKIFDEVNESSSSGRRWMHDHLKFSFQETSGLKALEAMEKMTLAGGIAEKIKMPTFVGLAERDIFFLGQPEMVAKAIGDNATLVRFGDDQAAAAHCQSGAHTYLNQQLLEWFGDVVGDKKRRSV